MGVTIAVASNSVVKSGIALYLGGGRSLSGSHPDGGHRRGSRGVDGFLKNEGGRCRVLVFRERTWSEIESSSNAMA